MRALRGTGTPTACSEVKFVGLVRCVACCSSAGAAGETGGCCRDPCGSEGMTTPALLTASSGTGAPVMLWGSLRRGCGTCAKCMEAIWKPQYQHAALALHRTSVNIGKVPMFSTKMYDLVLSNPAPKPQQGNAGWKICCMAATKKYSADQGLGKRLTAQCSTLPSRTHLRKNN